MLSTLAARAGGLKPVHLVRLFSTTPGQGKIELTRGEGTRVIDLDPGRGSVVVNPNGEIYHLPGPGRDDSKVSDVPAWPVEPSEKKWPTSDIIPITLEQRLSNWQKANEIFYGKHRDLKNYPHPEYLDEPKETYQIFLFPTRWFKNLYPRLGVTGGYTLFWGTVLLLLSKEQLVVNYEFGKLIAQISLFYYVSTHPNLGGKVKKMLDQKADEMDKMFYDDRLAQAKSVYLSEIQDIDTECDRKAAVPVIFEAKQELLGLQLEQEYRQRLRDAYESVKSRLDYQADVEATQRSFEQQYMVKWIVDNVRKSITPQQEKETITSCIQTLKNLSQTATV